MINSAVNTDLLQLKSWKAIKSAIFHCNRLLEKKKRITSVGKYLCSVSCECQALRGLLFYQVLSRCPRIVYLHITKHYSERKHFRLGKESLARATVPQSNVKGPKNSCLSPVLSFSITEDIHLMAERKKNLTRNKATFHCKMTFFRIHHYSLCTIHCHRN